MDDTEEGQISRQVEGDSGAEAHRSTSVMDVRLERLLRILLWVGDASVARVLRNFPVGEFEKQPVAIRTALLALRRKRDPATALRQPQYRPTVPLVAEAVSEACLDAVVSALGDAADHPDRRQLLDALEEIRDRFPTRALALMLAYVSVTDMPAADLCDEVLASDERFTPTS